MPYLFKKKRHATITLMSKANLLNVIAIERIIIAVLMAALVGASFYVFAQKQQIASLSETESNLQSEKTTLLEELNQASSTIVAMETRLSELGENFEDLEDDYKDERNKNEEFEDQLKDLGKTVGVLDKLSKTDKELLQKYSKVYFLNEH